MAEGGARPHFFDFDDEKWGAREGRQ